MRVLAVDPGLTRCGVAVVEGRRSPLLRHITVIQTEPSLDVARRLVQIEAGLVELVEAWLPDVVAVERVFAQNNRNTVIPTAQAAGTVMLVAARLGILVAQHTPSEVKAAVTGSGRADKDQVGHMVQRVLRLDTVPRPADAADAAALALCQLWRGGTGNAVAEALAREQRDRPELQRAAELADRQRRTLAAAARRHGRGTAPAVRPGSSTNMPPKQPGTTRQPETPKQPGSGGGAG